MAGKTVHFPDGTWSGLPETGPDKKVRQCVLVAKRARGAAGEGIDTALSLTIGRGSGLAIAIGDDKLPSEAILDDQAEIVVGDHAFPATAFTVRSGTLAFHPADAAGVLSALDKATTLRLHSGWRRHQERRHDARFAGRGARLAEALRQAIRHRA